MYVLIARTTVNEYYSVTIKICIVLTNFEKQNFLAKYNVLKPQMNKEKYHVKLLSIEFSFTLTLYCIYSFIRDSYKCKWKFNKVTSGLLDSFSI